MLYYKYKMPTTAASAKAKGQAKGVYKPARIQPTLSRVFTDDSPVARAAPPSIDEQKLAQAKAGALSEADERRTQEEEIEGQYQIFVASFKSPGASLTLTEDQSLPVPVDFPLPFDAGYIGGGGYQWMDGGTEACGFHTILPTLWVDAELTDGNASGGGSELIGGANGIDCNANYKLTPSLKKFLIGFLCCLRYISDTTGFAIRCMKIILSILMFGTAFTISGAIIYLLVWAVKYFGCNIAFMVTNITGYTAAICSCSLATGFALSSGSITVPMAGLLSLGTIAYVYVNRERFRNRTDNVWRAIRERAARRQELMQAQEDVKDIETGEKIDKFIEKLFNSPLTQLTETGRQFINLLCNEKFRKYLDKYLEEGVPVSTDRLYVHLSLILSMKYDYFGIPLVNIHAQDTDSIASVVVESATATRTTIIESFINFMKQTGMDFIEAIYIFTRRNIEIIRGVFGKPYGFLKYFITPTQPITADDKEAVAILQTLQQDPDIRIPPAELLDMIDAVDGGGGGEYNMGAAGSVVSVAAGTGVAVREEVDEDMLGGKYKRRRRNNKPRKRKTLRKKSKRRKSTRKKTSRKTTVRRKTTRKTTIRRKSKRLSRKLKK